MLHLTLSSSSFVMTMLDRLTDSVRNSNAVVLEANVDVDARDSRSVGQLARLVVQVDLLAGDAEVNLKKIIDN